jgi:hypothetical protein
VLSGKLGQHAAVGVGQTMKPRVFVGCSHEAREFAAALHVGLRE